MSHDCINFSPIKTFFIIIILIYFTLLHVSYIICQLILYNSSINTFKLLVPLTCLTHYQIYTPFYAFFTPPPYSRLKSWKSALFKPPTLVFVWEMLFKKGTTFSVRPPSHATDQQHICKIMPFSYVNLPCFLPIIMRTKMFLM
jgi:hypothetical protein